MPQQTIVDLGKLVKQKYPGAYDDMADDALGKSVKAKYPGAYDDFTDVIASPTKESAPGILSNIFSGAKDVAEGAGREIVSQGRNLLSIVNPTQYEVPELPLDFLKKTKEPGGQSVGSTIVNVAEMLLAPEAMGIPKAAAAIKNPWLRGLFRTGAEGVTAAGITGAQTGDPEEAMYSGLMVGGLTGIGSVIGAAMAKGGGKIQSTTIRPRAIDYADGYDPKTVTALGLKGNLKQSYEQVEGELTKLRTARNALLDPKTTKPIDLQKIFIETADDMNAELAQLKNAGQAGAYKKAIKELHDDIESVRQGNMVLNIREAENAKEGMGLLGAWAYGRTDMDAAAKEKVANKLYLKLKGAIENSLPSGSKVGELNAQMHKIIPVRNAMLARIPVEERNSLLSLTDMTTLLPAMISGNALDASLIAASRLQKSHRFGNWLSRMAQSTSMVAPSEIPGKIGKILAAYLTGTDQSK